ncbi:PrpF protein, partial [Mammaliicoccus sciuri]
IKIGHPSGSISYEGCIRKNERAYKLINGGTGRTARIIMEGNAVIPISLMDRK